MRVKWFLLAAKIWFCPETASLAL